jgi:hypothetical protein
MDATTGFYKAYTEVKATVDQIVNQTLAEDPTYTLHVTGHRLVFACTLAILALPILACMLSYSKVFLHAFCMLILHIACCFS